MDLPPDAKNIVHANRKIEVIKVLHVRRNLGLEEAKEIIDACFDEDRPEIDSQCSGRKSAIGRIPIIIISGGIVCAAHRAFSWFQIPYLEGGNSVVTIPFFA